MFSFSLNLVKEYSTRILFVCVCRPEWLLYFSHWSLVKEKKKNSLLLRPIITRHFHWSVKWSGDLVTSRWKPVFPWHCGPEPPYGWETVTNGPFKSLTSCIIHGFFKVKALHPDVTAIWSNAQHVSSSPLPVNHCSLVHCCWWEAPSCPGLGSTPGASVNVSHRVPEPPPSLPSVAAKQVIVSQRRRVEDGQTDGRRDRIRSVWRHSCVTWWKNTQAVRKRRNCFFEDVNHEVTKGQNNSQACGQLRCSGSRY